MWSEGIDFNILTYLHECKNASKYFILFKDQLVIYNNITNSRITLQKEEKILRRIWIRGKWNIKRKSEL